MNNIAEQDIKLVKDSWGKFARVNLIIAVITFIVSILSTIYFQVTYHACESWGCLFVSFFLIVSYSTLIYTLIYWLTLKKKIKTTISSGLSKLGKLSLIFFSLPIYLLWGWIIFMLIDDLLVRS